jgi:hypothetical protein
VSRRRTHGQRGSGLRANSTVETSKVLLKIHFGKVLDPGHFVCPAGEELGESKQGEREEE